MSNTRLSQVRELVQEGSEIIKSTLHRTFYFSLSVWLIVELLMSSVMEELM